MLRTAIKRVRSAIETGDKAAASAVLQKATGVIDRIADHPASQLDDLLPWNWQAARQQKAA